MDYEKFSVLVKILIAELTTILGDTSLFSMRIPTQDFGIIHFVNTSLILALKWRISLKKL
jgi:hypothetical protein